MAATGGGVRERNVGQVYLSFLVRYRLEEGAGPNREAQWRFTIQQTGAAAARHSCACLEDVLPYLEVELEESGRWAVRPG